MPPSPPPDPDTSKGDQHLQDFLRRVLKKISLPKAARALDFGCADGELTRDTLECKPAGLKALRPRLRHLERLEFDEYMRALQDAISTQTKGHYSTLPEIAALARSK